MVGDMKERYFLRIDGIEGESTDDRHAREIDVSTWSWGAAAASGSTSSGRVGKATLQDLRIVKRIDVATPKLIESCVTGKHLPRAVLAGVRWSGDGDADEFLRDELEDVTVTSVDHADADTEPVEQISLAYRSFEITYTPQSPTGGAGTPVSFKWDVKKQI